MFNDSAEKIAGRLAAATAVGTLVDLMEAYAFGVKRRLPDSCRSLQVNDAGDLFNWWLEFDRLSSESRESDGLLAECRDLFGAAWEKAATLGYRLQRPGATGARSRPA